MRKLILAVAVLAGSISSFALPINTVQNETIDVVANEEFKEITLDKLPELVSNAIKKDFASATISKVYVNASEQYKIILTVDDKSSMLYSDKEGNWLKETDIKTE